MKKGYLSDYFTGIAAKHLSAVEADTKTSNQHEFDGVANFKKILGVEKRKFPALFMYFCDDEDSTITADGFLTWYDARENHPKRSEYRLYFPTTAVSEQAEANDLLIIAKRPDNSIFVIVAQANSTAENQLLWLFGLQLSDSDFELKKIDDSKGTELNYAAKLILENLGFEPEEPDDSYMDIMLSRFAADFPTTRIFSAFARETLSGIKAREDPDTALVQWMEQEEMLFRTMERHLVAERLRVGFGDDVDDFISFSLSVQNRRKSRVGYAFENHLEQIFREWNIKYSRNQVTENNSKPDFIFPAIAAYRDPLFPHQRLTMLGVKTTCKDRWRQVLAEAARIPEKHLATMEPSISINQTNEMQAHNLGLVIPKSIHETYSASQRQWIMGIADFISLLERK